MKNLYEMEIDRINWRNFETLEGDASKIPSALVGLMSAPVDEAEKFYWQIENHVVVQGELFSSAEPTVDVILAALSEKMPRHTTIDLLELLFQMTSAAVLQLERRSDVYEKLQKKVLSCAKNGVWLLYKYLDGDHKEAAKEVISLLDQDRLNFYLAHREDRSNENSGSR